MLSPRRLVDDLPALDNHTHSFRRLAREHEIARLRHPELPFEHQSDRFFSRRCAKSQKVKGQFASCLSLEEIEIRKLLPRVAVQAIRQIDDVRIATAGKLDFLSRLERRHKPPFDLGELNLQF